MMSEEIRPTHIEQPRRVRSLSRDEREERGENRDRFTHDLATLAREETAGKRHAPHPTPVAEEPATDAETELPLAEGPEDDASRPGLGRNLDITT
jgi:hypothetical protein